MVNVPAICRGSTGVPATTSQFTIEANDPTDDLDDWRRDGHIGEHEVGFISRDLRANYWKINTNYARRAYVAPIAA